MAPRIVAPYTRSMCVRVHLDGRYHANITQYGSTMYIGIAMVYPH